jgi:hypothetical protein
MRRALIPGLVALALATSCSGGGDDAAEPEPVENSETTEATTTTLPATTTTAPVPGAVVDNDGGTVALLAYDQPVADGAPAPVESSYPDGYVWSAIDVEVCVPAAPDEYAVVNYLWSLTMPDNSIIEPSSSTYQGFPQPEYPFEQMVSPGQCVRGWITFAVPGDSRPTGVQYTPPGKAPLKWSVPA